MTKGKWFVLFVALVSVFAGSRSARAEEPKFAFVDVAELFDKYEKTKAADKQLAEEGKNKQALRDTYVQEIRRMQDELVVLSDEKKKGKQEEIDRKIRDLQQFDDKTRQDLKEKRDTVVKQIIDDIDAKVEALGKKRGFDYILNSRLLLFKNPKYDITQEILTQLNGEYKK